MTHQTTGFKRLFTPELIAVLFVWCMAFFAGEILSPILPLYMATIGLDAPTIGMLFSIMMVGIAISEVFWGWVVDRIDLKIAILVGTMMYGIIIGVLTQTKTMPMFAVVIFFYGFSRSPIFIVGRWFMGVYAPPDLKATAMALLSISISTVQAISGFASGFITEAKGFIFTFWLAAAFSVSAGIVIMIVGRWLNFQNHKTDAPKLAVNAVKPVSVSRKIKLITVSLGFIGTLFFICYGLFATYMPLYASGVAHASTVQVGNLFGVRGLVSTLAMLPVGRLADRKGKWSLLPVAMVVVAISMVAIALSKDYGFLLVGTMIFSIGSALYLPTGTSILSENVPVFWTGTAMGIYGLMEDIGWMIGPVIGGILWASWSQPSTFLFGSVMALLGVPLILILRRRVIQPTAPPLQQIIAIEKS